MLKIVRPLMSILSVNGLTETNQNMFQPFYNANVL